jgi:hypothetical protein
VTWQDNEDNGTTAIKVMNGLQRAYKGQFHEQAEAAIQLAIKMFR